MDRNTYQRILRVIGLVVAVLMWTISVYFSQDGFAINLPAFAWIGWILALCVTGIEMIWNSEGFRHNMTIIVVGLAAYGYGIWTNVMGIVHAQGTGIGDIGENPFVVFLPIILGVFLEITPEPLLMWALVGIAQGDLLSHLVGEVGHQGKQAHQEQPAQKMPPQMQGIPMDYKPINPQKHKPEGVMFSNNERHNRRQG